MGSLESAGNYVKDEHGGELFSSEGKRIAKLIKSKPPEKVGFISKEKEADSSSQGEAFQNSISVSPDISVSQKVQVPLQVTRKDNFMKREPDRGQVQSSPKRYHQRKKT